MVLSSSLGALKYPPSDKKCSLLNHPKTALAVSHNERSVCSDVSGTLGRVEWLENRKLWHSRDIKMASDSMCSCRREMKTEIAPGKEMRWSETTPHANPLFPGSQSDCTGSRLRVCLAGEWERIWCSLRASTRVLWTCFFNCTDETGWLLINGAFGLNDRSNFTYCDERLWKSVACEMVPESFRSF